MAKKDIWDQAITMHTSFTQKTNFILVELAKDFNLPARRIIEKLLEESSTFQNKKQELENKGIF